MQYLTESRFTELLVNNNPAGINNFREWIFYPSMLFGSTNKWWNSGKRDNPHEGLDLCFYADQSDKILRINEGVNIPAMFDGIVIGIIDDFLGKSIIVEHNIAGNAESLFYSIFGHVIPACGIDAGSDVKQGDIIAVLADARRSKAKVFPHLHITIGYLSRGGSFPGLNWSTISNPEIFTLFDPVTVIGDAYSIITDPVT